MKYFILFLLYTWTGSTLALIAFSWNYFFNVLTNLANFRLYSSNQYESWQSFASELFCSRLRWLWMSHMESLQVLEQLIDWRRKQIIPWDLSLKSLYFERYIWYSRISYMAFSYWSCLWRFWSSYGIEYTTVSSSGTNEG